MADSNTPLQDLQSAYASICRKLAELYSDPKPSYTLPSGASVDRNAYRKSLLEEQEELRKIPGVAPDTNPTFEIIGD